MMMNRSIHYSKSLFGRLNPCHHLFLGDKMIDSLQETQEALHVVTPLIENIVSISGLSEANNSCRSVNLGINGLGGYKLANVLLGLVLGKIQ